MSSIKDDIDPGRLPRHIAIIMDGNGRWAMQHGQNRIYGHENGVESVRQTAEACAELGIECLTLYAFSTENWKRSKEEVSGLLRILGEALAREAPKLHKNGIQIRHLGSLDGV
ncbi:MAG: polyprenyl diphosphate synthase, partial [Bacteroidota bacterium]|nr:polyprenyl diphosphate synthase [Bacteroidota bacterium]